MVIFRYHIVIFTILLFLVKVNCSIIEYLNNFFKNDNTGNIEKDVKEVFYCNNEISSSDIDLISCQRKETLTECFRCIDSLKIKKNVPNMCIDELYSVCRQKVKELDNCHNRCNKPCFCAGDGTCRKPSRSGTGTDPCNY